LRYSANGVIEAGEPFNIIATHDGVFTTYSSVHLYKDGVEISYGASPVNGVTESDVSGIWNIGARSSDDLRNTNGKLSQIRIFNVVLTPAEIALESAGIYTTIRGLVFWWKGNTDSLVDVVGSVEGTADGTTQLTGVGNGPTIYYP
jgi:hypothetical protein